jgi:hypothetical protein
MYDTIEAKDASVEKLMGQSVASDILRVRESSSRHSSQQRYTEPYKLAGGKRHLGTID